MDDHVTVLLDEAVDSLSIKENGIYIDGTFGRGGHSRLILSRLGHEGRLVAIDRDPQAVKNAESISDRRFEIVHDRFSNLRNILNERELWGNVDGVLFDLGVSSPQLDDAQRGFSFSHDGPLDMRMDPTRGVSAAQWLASATENDIAWVLKEFGEEKCARRIARAIVADRESKPYERTQELAAMIARVVRSSDPHKHPATRSFQAIRIYINSELEELRQALADSVEALASGGRIAVISFHSLEDRIVKNFFRNEATAPEIPRGLPVLEADIRKNVRLSIAGKPIKPTDEEISRNPRSRSAVLRVAQKL